MIKTKLISLITGILITSVIMGGCAPPATPVPSQVPTSTPAPAPELPEPSVVSGKQGVDMSSYGKIELDADHIEVSSTHKDWGKEHLLKEAGFWHVPVPKETNEAWVMVDLERQRQLDALTIKPRPDLLKHLWQGDAAVLEGSDDKQTWTALVRLELDHNQLNDQDWITFVLPEEMGAYRYYRLFINSPDFISMAGLELYGEGGLPTLTTPTPSPTPIYPDLPVASGEQGTDMSGYGKIALDASQLEVSSVFKDWGKEHLLKEAGFWHVKVPKETNEAWVMVDLESQRQLDALTIKPRPDLLEHLWQGDAAVLEGSDDKQTWTALVRLELDHNQLNDQDWITFVLPEDIGSYRYYRLFINSPDFISMAGLNLYSEGGVPTPTTPTTPTPSPTPIYPDLPMVSGEQGTDMSSYGKIALDASQLEVSSTYKDWGEEHLLKEAGFWHVPGSKETNEAWVSIDLESQRQLDAIAVKPRPDLLEHLWKGGAAILEGSNDEQIWTAEITLELNHDQLNDQEWITFILPEDIGSYRYYRLFINSPDFISMAGLELYGEGGVVGQFPTPIPPDLAVASGRHDVDLMGRARIIPNVFNVRVSSRKKPHYQYKLFREAGIWHVMLPKETNEAWVRIDLESQRQLGALAVKPRPDHLYHLWQGQTAVLEGSDDKQTWTALVILELDHDQLNDQDWINFVLPEDIGAYRYFRLFIYDPGFFSMAGLRLYK